MSAATFSLVLCPQCALRYLISYEMPLGSMLMSMIVFLGPKAHIDDLLDTISDELSRADLSINHDKTTIWCPDGVSTSLSTRARDTLLSQPRCDGLVVVGQPLWMLDPHNVEGAVPVGSDSFVQAFLASLLRAYERRINSLQAVVNCTAQTTTSCHIGFYILVTRLLSRRTHLMRSLCPSFLLDTFRRVDNLNLMWMQNLFHCDAFPEVAD